MGKARKLYEFGCKVGIAATNRAGLFQATRAFEGNPYDGHTLQATTDQAEVMSGVAIQRAHVEKGYKGHGYLGSVTVILSGRRRNLTPQMKREFKRRSAVEPMIGHAKIDSMRGKNHLLGHFIDKINALPAASGHYLRFILNTLALLFVQTLAALLGALAKPDTWP